jgi:putative membrane protein
MPELNAVLNSISAFFLILGFRFIRQKKVEPHKACMLIATGASTLFLISYIYYHATHGSKHFTGEGWVRPLYFTILITHTFLAAIQLPLILATLNAAFKNKIDSHRRLARITWPIWLYVSITGVIIYIFLYQLYP